MVAPSKEEREMRCGIAFVFAAVCAAACSKNDTTGPSQSGPALSFFVTSTKSPTGNLGGLTGADTLCQNLAAAVGAGSKRWRAYLSVERDASNGGQKTDARSR